LADEPVAGGDLPAAGRRAVATARGARARRGAGDPDPGGAVRQVGTRKWERGTERPLRIAVPRCAFRVPRSILLLLAGAGCALAREPQLFERRPPDRTGVTFANRLPHHPAVDLR